LGFNALPESKNSSYYLIITKTKKMKKTIFGICISGILVFVSCAPDNPHGPNPAQHFAQGSTAQDIKCPTSGSNCVTRADADAYQSLNSERFGNITQNQAATAFYAYYNQGNPKGIFSDPTYSAYFSLLIGNDIYTKIMNNTYRFLVAADGSIVVVKSLTGGLTIANIVFAIDRDNVI
jgi:hypothetical protein